jgi:hypothetical protein
VTPALKRLAVLRGERVRATTTLGVPARASSASVRIETPEGYARYRVGSVDDRESLTVNWTVSREGARVRNFPVAGGEAPALPSRPSEVDLVVTFVAGGGATVTYRQELTVDRTANGVRAVWPPETRVCSLTTECGREGTYVGPDGDYVSGVSVNGSARAVDGSA